MVSLVPFLAILNPFALCLYLAGLMETLPARNFIRVLAGACVISLAVFAIFALSGERLLVDWLGIHPQALRAFGGLIFLIVGYNYVVRGYKATEILRGSLEDLPSAVALPFMIGAGTITQSILIGKSNGPGQTLFVLALGVSITFLVVMAFKFIRDHVKGPKEKVFERYINILARINGLLIGAISTEMIVSGLRDLWALP